MDHETLLDVSLNIAKAEYFTAIVKGDRLRAALWREQMLELCFLLKPEAMVWEFEAYRWPYVERN